jgi:L-fuculose-phosphate aldolase
MSAGPELRRAVVAASHELAGRGWVANHDGNVTARAGRGRFLATPTATAKARVTERLLLEVDAEGKRTAGNTRPFGELNLHLALYARRADVGAVVHAHPPYATALAASGTNLIERPFIAEAVISIGPWIPLGPFVLPGVQAAEVLAGYADDVDAVLMQNHGAIAWGADVEQAMLRLELVEHLARIASLAQATGGIVPLPVDAMRTLAQKRASSGLGAAADRAEAVADRVLASPGTAAPAASRDHLKEVIKEELARALKA